MIAYKLLRFYVIRQCSSYSLPHFQDIFFYYDTVCIQYRKRKMSAKKRCGIMYGQCDEDDENELT